MVLTKRILIGLFLLVLVTCSSSTSVRRRQRQITTPTTENITITITTEETRTQTPPKTENASSISNTRRRRLPTTTTSTTKLPQIKHNNTQEIHKNDRQDTARSLDITKEKYLAPEYHNENNVFSESKLFEKEVTKPVEYEKMFHEIVMTTPKDHIFDEILMTTPKDHIFDEMVMTTPKDHIFDNRHKELQEEVSKVMEEREKGFDRDEYNTRHRFDDHSDDFKTTPVDESQMNVRGYKQIDTSESRVKNKVHKDYNMEEGKKMEMLKSYNVTKVFPEDVKKLDDKNVVLETAETKSIQAKLAQKSQTAIDKTEISTEKQDTSTKTTSATVRRTSTTKRQTSTTERQISTTKRQINTTTKPVTSTVKTTNRTPTRYVRTRPTKPKPADLDQQSSIQIENIQIQEIDRNLMKALNISNDVLTKEHLDPIIQSDKEILINKRVKTKQKTTPVANLEDLNIVEVTTSMKKSLDPQSSTESVVKSQKIASLDMKTVDVISPKEISSETTIRIEEVTTMSPVEDTTVKVESTTDLGMSTTPVDAPTTDFVMETTVVDQDMDTTTSAGEITTPTEMDETTTEIVETTTKIGETTTQMGEPTTTQLPIESTTFLFDEDITNFRDLMEEILTNSTDEPYETTTKFFEVTDSLDTTFYEVSTVIMKTSTEKVKNDSTLANEIIKIEPKLEEKTKPEVEGSKLPEVSTNTLDNSTKLNDNDIIKQNEINVNSEKSVKSSTTEEPIEKDCEVEPCDEVREPEHDEDYIEGMPKKAPDMDDLDENQEKLDKFSMKVPIEPTKATTPLTVPSTTTKRVFENRKVEEEAVEIDVTTIPSGLTDDEEDGGNGGKIAAIVISTVGGVCLLLLVGLLIVMRKRQKRFNYGQRCRPVSLDAYNMDNVSIHNSTRRKGVLMASKRSYGNPAFEDPNCPSHPLNYLDLVKFAKNTEEVFLEFEKIPQVQAKTSELPDGCEAKNRYANIIPLPESRVSLTPIDGHPNSDYINANYVAGAKGQRRYYIACQAPMANTIEDFWRMIWEQESKVVLMLTHLYEQGVEKCIDYLPPSEVLDCHRLFGDFQVTLKKREVRDKYIISSLQLKNMVSNSWREVTHMWYMDWPHKGVPEEANSLIRFLIEARSYIKTNENKTKEGNTSFINGSAKSNGSTPVVVHCSPGTGRTGTVIACDIAIREFEMTRNVDIPKIVYKIRRDRASSVQTKDQYSYIYNVINLYATKLTGGAFDSF